MRIIKEIPHKYLKITVFKHQQRLQIKIQHEVYEVILNYRDGEILDEDSFLKQLEASTFIGEMEKKIFEIHQIRMKVLNHSNENLT